MSADGGDYGLFGPGSVTWRVMAEPILMVAGFRALLFQGLHPRAMRGVVQNSELMDSNEALARLQRTVEFVRVRTYGTTEEVERAGARVRKIHRTLSAHDPDTGTRFQLDDPDALLWVHVGEVESYLHVARRAGVSLTDAEADQFVAEWRAAAGVVGLAPSDVPGTVADMRAYIREMRPKLYYVPEARHPFISSLNAPLPLWLTPLRPIFPSMTLLAFATLPPWARRLYSLPILPLGDAATTAALRTLYHGTRLVPSRFRYSPDARRARALSAA